MSGDEGATPPVGERFTLVYSPKPRTLRDCQRFRHRLAAYLSGQRDMYVLVDLLSSEIGIDVPRGYNGILWQSFFKYAEMGDVLDSITFAGQVLQLQRESALQSFRSFVDRAFREQGLGYRVDEKCGVHFYVDEEFEAGRASTISALEDARYAGARAAFARGHECLDGHEPDTLGAVRGVFDAVENVFKQITGAPRIGASELTKEMRPKVVALHTGPAANASSQLLESLAKWVNAAHQYRHDPGHPDPAPPPLDVAVVMMASGAAFLRWLATLDAQLRI
jgi:hypothetical protein